MGPLQHIDASLHKIVPFLDFAKRLKQGCKPEIYLARVHTYIHMSTQGFKFCASLSVPKKPSNFHLN